MHKRCKSLIGVLCFSLLCTNIPIAYASNSTDIASVSSVKEVKVGEETISAPMLATIATLAVASGITLSSDDDIYDMGRLFYDYVQNNNELTWNTVVSAFESSVAFNQLTKQVTVGKEFGDIVKGFFDKTFGYVDENSPYEDVIVNVGKTNGFPDFTGIFENYYADNKYQTFMKLPGIDIQKLSIGDVASYGDVYSIKKISDYAVDVYNGKGVKVFDITLRGGIPLYLTMYYYNNDLYYYCPYEYGSRIEKTGEMLNYNKKIQFTGDTFSIPYSPGTYNPGNVWNDNNVNDVPIYVPGDLSDLLNGNPSDVVGDNAPSWVGDGTFTLPEVENPSINVDTSAAFLPEGCYKTPVVLNQEATILDVTVPLSFPVSVDSEGVVTVADNVEVVNNSIGPIQISDISIQSKDDWALSDFDKDYSAERVGLKEFSFKIEGQEISDSITLNKVVNGLDKCSIDYDSRVAPQKDSISDSNIADIVLTIDWYEN